MKKRIIVILLVLTGLAAPSCKLDLLDDPNNVTINNASPNFLLNSIQLSWAGFFNGTSDVGMRLTRMLNQGAAIYENTYPSPSTNGLWSTAYANILADVNVVIPAARRQNLFIHLGISRVARAYITATLVDYFGDVPFKEALQGQANFNPTIDPGAQVYTAALQDLDSALVHFRAVTATTPRPSDLFYNNDIESWIRLTNTLKLKLLLNRRLVDNGAQAAINALIAENLLISTSAQSFAFRYGSNIANPDSRHPRFSGQYRTGGGDYQSNFYMWHFITQKGFPDPRLRYYFYRQRTRRPTDVNEIRCITERAPTHYPAGMVFCLPSDDGYWGRDHLDNQGIPPDGLARTAWGIYPVGGRYDNNSGLPVNNERLGNQGAGLQPIMMSSFVDFMKSEAALMIGATGDPRALLESAVRKSMADVRSFALSSLEGGTISAFETSQNFVWATEVNRYVDRVLALYDAAPDNDGRLDVVLREYWLALHGNGVEAYNMYRRTGKPANMQPAIEANPGEFVRSLFYPNVFVATNSNAKQKPNVGVRVFWDNNPAGFVR